MSLAHYNIIQAYDSHCNLVLGDVEETVYMVEEDDEPDDIVKVRASCRLHQASLNLSRQ